MPKAKKSARKIAKQELAVHDVVTLSDYEVTAVVSPTVKAEKRADVVASLTGKIKSLGGLVSKTDEWGLKDLAYPIDHQRSGWYVCFAMKLPKSAVSMLDQHLIRDKALMRHLLVTI